MEILATHVDYGNFAFAAMLSILGLVVLLVALFDLDGGDSIFAIVGVILIFGGMIIFATTKPSETHDVLITDIKEVYEQGYEIIDQNGKIYTIQKVDE